MWFESSARLSALTSEILLNPSEFTPTIGVPPYPNMRCDGLCRREQHIYTALPRHGVWAATTTFALVRR